MATSKQLPPSKSSTLVALALGLVAVLGASAGCDEGSEEIVVPARTRPERVGTRADAASSDEINPRMLRRFQSIRGPFEADEADLSAPVVKLGKRLFLDPRLSRDDAHSCNSCHDLAKWGVDGQRTSTGVDGQVGRRNSPTVLNAAGNFKQFWDGRADTVEEQAGGPILNPAEMGMPSEKAVVDKLQRDGSYDADFRAAFPDEAQPLTFANLTAAIGAFERTLFVRGRWDEFLEGDPDALTPIEKKGLRAFLNLGCMVCHTGPNVGGMTLERAGVVQPWPDQSDLGRYEVTHVDADRMVFRVPTLRNVAKTAPYFHDGSAETLDIAVQMMGRHQLGIELTSEEVTSIVAWLDTLTGAMLSVLPGPEETKAVALKPSHAADEPRDSSEGSSTCGDRGQRPCPLQGWMRGRAVGALQGGDPATLERAFLEIAAFAPPGYDAWASHAMTGAAAAKSGDPAGAAIACNTCHAQYREQYRRELSAHPIR